MNFFNSKIKPNIIGYTNEELIGIIEQNNRTKLKSQSEESKESEESNESDEYARSVGPVPIETNNLSRDLMISKVNEIWNNLILGPEIDCPICLDSITNSNNMITNCGHYFHSTCMIKYIVMSKSNNQICCPKCRTNIYSKDEPNTNSNTDNEENNNFPQLNSNINWIQNINNQLITNSDSDSGSNSYSDSDSDSESNSDSGSNSEFNSRFNHIYQNEMTGMNSTVLNLFNNDSIPIDIVSGLWINQVFREQNQMFMQTNITNIDSDTDSDEEIKMLVSNK